MFIEMLIVLFLIPIVLVSAYAIWEDVRVYMYFRLNVSLKSYKEGEIHRIVYAVQECIDAGKITVCMALESYYNPNSDKIFMDQSEEWEQYHLILAHELGHWLRDHTPEVNVEYDTLYEVYREERGAENVKRDIIRCTIGGIRGRVIGYMSTVPSLWLIKCAFKRANLVSRFSQMPNRYQQTDWEAGYSEGDVSC